MTEQAMIEREPAQVSRVEERTRSGPTFRPNVDIIERPDELLVLADMPGVGPKDIDIQFENGVLTIYGRVAERQSPEPTFHRREYGLGDFYREFRVSEAIDASKIAAECRNGVLTLHLPKVEAVKPRKIEVKA